MISDAFWRSRFGASPDVIGRTLTTGDTVYTIVGVLPPAVTFPAHDTAIWTPLRIGDGSHRMRRTENYLNVVARRKRGVGLLQVQEDLDRLGRLLAAEYPAANAGVGIAAVPLHEHVTGQASTPLLLLVGVAAALLLISCANVAHLLLARAMSRSGELTLRAALGATRGRLLRQSFTESVLLALGGGALGVLAAVAVVEALRPSLPPALPRRHEIAVDATVLGYALVCTVVVCAVAAIAPALRAWRASLDQTLKGSRQTSTPRATLLGQAAVVLQVALSLVLLVGTMLLLRSLHNLLTTDSGFAATNVLVTAISVPGNGQPTAASPSGRVVESFEALVEQVSQMPGVEAAGLVNHLPLSNDSSGTRFTVERQVTRPEEVPTASYRVISPAYFTTVRGRLLRGRYFSASDRPDSPPVFIINETMARRYWPDRDPVGSRIRRGGTDSTMAVHDGCGCRGGHEAGRPRSRDQARDFHPAHAISMAGDEPGGADLATTRSIRCRPAGHPDTIPGRAVSPNHQAFRGSDLGHPESPCVHIEPDRDLHRTGLDRRDSRRVCRDRARDSCPNEGDRDSGSAGRIPASVLHVAVGQTMRLVGLALAVGAVGAYVGARVMSNSLFGIAPFDPATYAAAAITLGLIAAVATLGPARRALRIDPLVALRSE